jgi:branched-chain amino acid aminotransferase
MTMRTVWLDGKLVDADDATVSVGSHGLHYGLGFFEGIRCHRTADGPAIFRLSDHLRRLSRSAGAYLVPLPYAPEELADACKAVVAENSADDCYLRPIVFLGDGPLIGAPWRAAVLASENGPMVGGPKPGGVSAKIVSFNRMSSTTVPPAVKATGQYLNSYLAQTEAMLCGFDEAILLNTDGEVTDGWAHNLFVVRDGALVTPPLSAGALGGITRATLLTLAAELGIGTAEETLVRTDLYGADECFLSGTSAGVVPVASVDRRPVTGGSPGPVTARLAEALADVQTGRTGAHAEWREPVR